MIIKELYIENFGKLSGFRQKFSRGLNVFVKENGYGKTTLAAFIKAMLYGIESNRKHSLLDNPRKRYTPWQGGYFGGWMIYECGGIEYKVERSFGSKASLDTLAVTELKSGKAIPLPSVTLGEHLFDIDEEGFEKTVFLSETNIYMNGAPDSVSSRLAGITGIEGDVNGFDQAIELIDKQRKALYKKGGAGMVRDAQEAASALESTLREISAAEARSAELEASIISDREKLSLLKGKKDLLLEKRNRKDKARLISGLAEEYASKKRRLDEAKRNEGELLEFFKQGIPEFTEISKQESALTSAASLLAGIKSGSDNHEISCPFRVLPDTDKIAELSMKASGGKTKGLKGNTPWIILLFTTLISIGAGFITPYAFIAAAVLLAVTIFGFITSRNRNGNSNDEAREYIKTVYGEERDGEILPLLISMRAELESYLQAKTRDEAEKAADEKRKRGITENATALSEGAKQFLSRFPTVTDKPFEEIRQKLYAYRAISESVKQLATECKEFEKLHGTETLSRVAPADENLSEIDNAIASLQAEISALEEKRLIAENEQRGLLHIADGRAGVEAEYALTLEKAEKYKKTLAIITKTQELLAKAKTNMTARYLDKTRAKFLEYTSYISGNGGEFTIDTDFAIRKTDLGAERHSDSYSRGQRELYQLSLRLALIYSIYDKEYPPIILDDPFISLDDDGATRGIKLLEKLSTDGQIIYFACSKSRG